MKQRILPWAIVAMVVAWNAAAAARPITVLEPPGKDQRPSIGPGQRVLINGRLLTPAGRTALTQSYSWGMAVSPDESAAVLLSRNAFQIIATAEPKVVDRFPAFGAKAPKWLEDGAYMGCAFSPDGGKLYLGSANHGEIIVFDLKARAEIGRININGDGYRDSFLGDFLVGDDGKFLYGVDQFNCRMVVVDLRERRLAGYIPAGWFCSFVYASRDGKRLFVSSPKGIGSGPNGGRGFVAPARGSHPGDIMQGLFQVIDIPNAARLADCTRQVVANTYRKREVTDDGRNPLPPAANVRRSPIRHIVFIVKENRTFDQVFGERKNVEGDPTLASLGCHVRVANRAGPAAGRNSHGSSPWSYPTII